MFARFAFGAGLLFGLAFVHTASAQEMNRIAAVVNDDIITTQELIGRMQLALVYSGIRDSADARRRVAPQVLRKLIDEHLQMQEAARLKISLTPSEVDAGIAMIEQQNGMPRGALLDGLRQSGLDPQLARDQIKADLTWMRLTNRVLLTQAKVGDQEVYDRLETIKERQGQPEYLLSEILLPVDNPGQEDEARTLGERLIEQLRAGAPFPALARQFSRSPTAANGGSLGWQSQAGLDEDVAAAVAQLPGGQVSPLVRTASGFAILRMDNQRIAGQVANPEDAVVTLSQIVLPTPKDAPPKQELMGRAAQLAQQAKSCSDLEELGRKVGATTIGSMGPSKRVGELESTLRRAVGNLPPNQASMPLDMPEGIQIVMVCERKESLTISLPTHEQVRRTLEDERMDMLSRRYIRNLRRAAFIDIRG
jgi:Parvulin-like peptidyl-prolyl isomerase